MGATAQLQLLGVCALGLIGATGAILYFRVRRKPTDKEKFRRAYLNRVGRLGHAEITDADDGTLFYSYEVRGVAYRTSQDISQLASFLPGSPEQTIGPVTLKYAPRNPADSIVICESWSGLRLGAKENSIE